MIGATGFIFWGLFVVFGVIVALYIVWMRHTERRHQNTAPRQAERDGESE